MRIMQRLHRPAFALAALGALGLGVIAPHSQADDRDLLRVNTSKPYLFILLDTSASMTLAIDGSWVEAGADDPRSRLYQAKEALYDVFSTVSSVHFGFATFNQDNVHATSKHFLHYVEDTPANVTALGGWPLGYPAVEPGNVVEVANATDPLLTDVQIDGDMMNFGKIFPGVPGGTCASPLQLNTERERINRYSKLGVAPGNVPTVLWIRDGGRTYKVTVARDSGSLGEQDLEIEMTAERVSSCSPVTLEPGVTIELEMGFWREFFMADSSTNTVEFQAVPGGGNNTLADEDLGGAGWDFLDIEGSYSCGSGKPFSGTGWEGNYDSGDPFDPNNLDNVAEIGIGTVDTFCLDPSDLDSCTNDLGTPSSQDATFPFSELDRGDLLPLHWDRNNKNAFLNRLNPRHGTGQRSFDGASFFTDRLDPSKGALRLLNKGQRPVVAAGLSPLAFAMNDFRCWYRGGPSDPKCKNPNNSLTFLDGFESLAAINDLDWECRRPYFIVITDSEDNCPGNAPTAVIANLFSKSAIRTWALNVGTGKLNNIVQPGKGEEIEVTSRQDLRDELGNILGIILEEARSFASAAVPSVQADVADKTFLTQFTPLQGETDPPGDGKLLQTSYWPGRADGFLKPIPINDTVTPPVPDTRASAACDANPANPRESSCHLWNAGEEMLDQAPLWADLELTPPAAVSFDDLKLGAVDTGSFGSRRRTVYAMAADDVRYPKGHVPRPRKFFYHSPPDLEEFTQAGIDPQVALNNAREDLWIGLGLYDETFELGNTPDVLMRVLLAADLPATMDIFKKAYTQKTALIGLNDDELTYVLGDIFHSNPQVVGEPRNARFLSDPQRFPLYDTFFEVQKRRRKVLLFGANDGMLHAVDAGVYEAADPFNAPLDGEFTNGSGKELWSYVPRTLLPTVAQRATSQDHIWGMDGTPSVADVFVDIQHDGGPFGTEREWRTVLVSGLRRGGRALYALDITKPDPMRLESQRTPLGGIEEGWVPETDDIIGGCFGNTDGTASNTSLGETPTDPDDPNLFGNETGKCDSGPMLRYPIPLWEFSDDDDDEGGVGNGAPDLGETWSTPNIGAIIVRDNIDGENNVGDFPCPDDPNERCQKVFVAVFGGGMDPDGNLTGGSGNWLYMVDIETGKMIYKRQLGNGSTPGAPAAVDTNQDGFLDRIYIGTTEGFMYRVDMDTVPELTKPCTSPALTSGCLDPFADPEWDPYPIFDTGGRSIFFPPAVVFSAELGRYALAFGTGNRDTLWSVAPPGGNRFYVFIDDFDFLPAGSPPLTEVAFENVTNSQIDSLGRDLLQDRGNGTRGWYLELGNAAPGDPENLVNFTPANETVITSGTAISGLVAFSSFLPVVETGTIGGGGPGGGGGGGANALLSCARTGTSRNYVMLIDNGDAILDECVNGTCTTQRARGVGTLVSEPFVEQGHTKNPCDPRVENCGTDPCAGTEAIADVLKERVYPPNCKFGNYRFNLSTMRADTGVECIAQIPVCIIEKNWKEF